MNNLNKLDKYLYENLVELVRSGYLDENPRAKYKDGKDANTLSIRGGVYERYDISKGEIPITETRPIAWKTAIKEILVIYKDQSNKIEDFKKRGINYWDEWDIGDGTIGQRYSATIKRYDLMNKLLTNLEKYPFSKRHLINMYQYTDLEETNGLHPCFYETLWTISLVDGEKYLDLTLIGRSSDLLVAGTGINQVQYVALQMMVAKHLGIKVGLFELYRKNVHIYNRHIDQYVETIKRLGELRKRESAPQIELKLNVPDGTNFYDIDIEHFELVNYEPMKPQIKFDLGI